MRTILAYTLFLLTTLSGFAQQPEWPTYDVEVLKQMPWEQADLYLHDKLALHLNLKDNESLRKVYEVHSPHAHHLTFQHTINGVDVLHSGVKLHRMKDGSVIIQSHLSEKKPIGSTDVATLYIPSAIGLIAVVRSEKEHEVYPMIQYHNQTGGLVFEDYKYKYYKDTTAPAFVYAVNPINSADTVYGGNFIDNQDGTNAKLDSQRIRVNLPVQWYNNNFHLRTEFALHAEISGPFESEITTPDSFMFDRSMPGFEAVNAHFHINEVAEYVNYHGHPDLTDTITFDAHAFNGADNSAYNPADHTIQYGQGGVDDAEDGEVIVHEYIHAISEKASPNNTVGSERKSMEEGNCDYLAKAYSRSYNDNTPNKIFSWDGFNPFFSGIDINTNKRYPKDITGNMNLDRNIWSSALMCIHDYIGRQATDSVVLEHLYYQAAFAKMSDMAEVLLMVDSMNFNKRYYSPIKQCMVDAGFVKRGSNVHEASLNHGIKLINSAGFSTGDGTLQVILPEVGSATLYTALGQNLQTFNNTDRIELNPHTIDQGMYILHIVLGNREYSIKLVR